MATCSAISEYLKNSDQFFGNFSSIIKNTLVSKNYIGDLMKNYAEEERFMSQPREILISSFTLQNGTLITPLLLFLSTIGSCWHKKTPICWLHSKERLQQLCAVSSGCKKAKWWKSKLKCRRGSNSSYGYQTMERSRRTVMKYLSDKKSHAANNSKLFKKLEHVNSFLYEVELAKAQIEHKGQSLSGSSFINTQNCDFWSCTTTSSLNYVMQTSSKS